MSVKTTAYDMVAGRLREEILSRRLRPGQQLPPERELCDRFAASRITIRRALQILEQEVLIQRRQGSGTYVSPCPSRKIPLCCMDFSGSVARHAPDLRRKVERWGRQPAEAEIAAKLRLLPGDEVTYARRVDYLVESRRQKGTGSEPRDAVGVRNLNQRGACPLLPRLARCTPVATDEIYLAGSLSDRLSEKQLACLEFLEHWGRVQRLQFDYSTQVIEGLPARPPLSRLLAVRRGTPLLKETNIVYLVGGRPAGVFLSWYRHDFFRFEATFPVSTRRNGSVK